MTRPLRVWVTDTFHRSPFGQCEAIVAASTKTAAARAFGLSMHTFNVYAGETGNVDQIAQATSEPGVVFYRAIDDWRGPWNRDA